MNETLEQTQAQTLGASIGRSGRAVPRSLRTALDGVTEKEWALACEKVEAMSVAVFEEWARLGERIWQAWPDLTRDEAGLIALWTFPDGPDFGLRLTLDELRVDMANLKARQAAETPTNSTPP